MRLLPSVHVALLCAAVAAAGLACKKDPPSTPPANTTPPAATSQDTAPSTGGTDAPAQDGPTGDIKVEKSEELRFIEANAAIMCFEREKKKAPGPKERTEILKAHGFTGKAGETKFNDFSIRGEKDREWGRRTAERIKQETASVCPSDK